MTNSPTGQHRRHKARRLISYYLSVDFVSPISGNISNPFQSPQIPSESTLMHGDIFVSTGILKVFPFHLQYSSGRAGQSYRAESLTYVRQCYLQVDSVRIELNCRIPGWCPENCQHLVQETSPFTCCKSDLKTPKISVCHNCHWFIFHPHVPRISSP